MYRTYDYFWLDSHGRQPSSTPLSFEQSTRTSTVTLSGRRRVRMNGPEQIHDEALRIVHVQSLESALVHH